MPGFRYCSWCNGKGCMCCESERVKAAKAEAERAAKYAARSPDEIRKSLATLKAIKAGRPEGDLGAAIVLAMGRSNIDMDAVDAEIAAEEASLDAEYARQFPDGPQPLLTVSRSDPDSMVILSHAFHADVLTKAFGPGGGGMAEIERLAGEARAMQAKASEANPSP